MLFNLKNELTHYQYGLDQQYKSSDKINRVTRDDLQKFIDDKKSWIFVADDNGALVGYIAGEIRENHYLELDNIISGNIKNFVVKKSSRNKKVGRALYLAAIEFFTTLGIDYVEVSVNTKNLSALAAYKKLGFKEFQIKLNQRI